MNKNKTIKAWAVIWEKESAKEYGAKEFEILSIEPERNCLTGKRYEVKQGCKSFYIDCLAIFANKYEAECWRDKNNNWKVIKVEINF